MLKNINDLYGKKIVLLSAANNIHTIRWANGLASRGVDLHLISIHQPITGLDEKVKVHFIPVKKPFGYFTSVKKVKRLIKKIKPMLVNAHYATGYGLLAKLSKCTPLLLSVWGSDVYSFPKKSSLHRLILKMNLSSATAIASTSNIMAKETKSIYNHKNMFITPFGIDEFRFTRIPTSHKKEIIIGCVKTLEEVYGIDILIKSFSMAHNRISKYNKSLANNLRLIIAGKGSQKSKLIQLTKELNISHLVEFTGYINHDKVPMMLNNFDIYVALSNSESFGVAILEASACELPVVVSDADGLVEVTIENKTALVVPKKDVNKAADALIKLITDKALREKLGIEGRKHVLENYSWEASINTMLYAYLKTIELAEK